MELIDPPQEHNGNLTPLTVEYLRRSASWMRFLAILGFVMIGTILIGSIEIAHHFSFGFIITISYLLLAAFIFFPTYYLYQSSQAVREFVIRRDPQLLERAMIRQNQFWSYIGVIMLVYLIFIILAIIVGGATIMSMMHFMNHGHHVVNYPNTTT